MGGLGNLEPALHPTSLGPEAGRPRGKESAGNSCSYTGGRTRMVAALVKRKFPKVRCACSYLGKHNLLAFPSKSPRLLFQMLNCAPRVLMAQLCLSLSLSLALQIDVYVYMYNVSLRNRPQCDFRKLAADPTLGSAVCAGPKIWPKARNPLVRAPF